jgi:sugar/nucleoside kinase (ribokinase family)
VVVTRGAKGVCVAESKSVSCVESRRVDVHDPTGAGDVVFASYIAGRLDGASRRRAAELAADLTAEWLIDADRNVRC